MHHPQSILFGHVGGVMQCVINSTHPEKIKSMSAPIDPKLHSPSPCTVVMRCPSRNRSTLERYEEGPLSTTTSFSTWEHTGNTHSSLFHLHELLHLRYQSAYKHVWVCYLILHSFPATVDVPICEDDTVFVYSGLRFPLLLQHPDF